MADMTFYIFFWALELAWAIEVWAVQSWAIEVWAVQSWAI
jgi:hypothetical protein